MNADHGKGEEELTRLLLVLVGVAKPLELALHPTVVTQIGERADLEAQRVLYNAPVVAEAVVLCERLYRSFAYDTHLLVTRKFLA